MPPGDTAYNVSKAALKAVAESLSHDLVKGGRVTACLPSPASAPPVINRNATLQQWQNGMQAVILDLPGAALDEAKAALAADGIAVTALPTDVTDRAQIAAAKIDGARLGPVAVPMCNAGREGGGILSDENVWRRSGSKADKDSRLRFRRRHAIASGQQTVHEAVTSESGPGGTSRSIST